MSTGEPEVLEFEKDCIHELLLPTQGFWCDSPMGLARPGGSSLRDTPSLLP